MKKTLLVCYSTNCNPKYKSWLELENWQEYQDFSLFWDKPVDFGTWDVLQDVNTVCKNYDTLVILGGRFVRKYDLQLQILSDIKQTLKTFSGKKFCVGMPDGIKTNFSISHGYFLKDYWTNDLSQEFEEWKLNKNNIVFGSQVSRVLWTPDTYVQVQEDFDFVTTKTYQKATFFFENLHCETYNNLYTALSNLKKRILQCRADEKELVIPLNLIEYATMVEDIVLGVSLKEANLITPYWNSTVWDAVKNEAKQQEYFISYE